MTQHFEIEIQPPSNSDKDALDAEQIQQWLEEHRPRHLIFVEETQ